MMMFAACAASPTNHDDEILRRLAAIEAQLSTQQALINELHREQAADTVSARLDELSRKLAAININQQPPPPINPLRRELDRAAVYAVPIGTSPVLGSPRAKVTMVMVGEFACPFCRKAWDTVDDLRKKYGAELRVAYKTFVVHPQIAMPMQLAACAANRQGKWRAIAELLWTKAFDVRAFDQANIDAIAAQAGLDTRRYLADIAGPCPNEVRDEIAMMAKLGVGATPTFFINGRVLSGAMPIEQFATLIDEELAKATAAIKGGVKPERYYEQEIVGRGLKELALPSQP